MITMPDPRMCMQIIPDIDARVVVSCIGTPHTHARFLRRKCGTYGPANLLTLTGTLPTAVRPLDNVYCCGDSVFPGVGTPAVAASGMWVANTLTPLKDHLALLARLGV
jgi:phytoene dehydrogenase-like protein